MMDDKYLVLDIEFFCRDMINAALAWLAAAESTVTYQTNYARFMRVYPNGLPYLMRGWPVIT